ncbi:MAG TPA: VOC family protein [Candidatus Acidoferrales bacterium]|nr:VOC family protein [Candidatus Acidoferrales bacterium]
MKITAVLIVEEIEKSLAFWVDRMAFEKTVDVPDGDKLGFVILARNGAELMMQTISSVRKDEPAFAPEAPQTKGCGLFIEVDDFEDVKRRLDGYPIAMPERLTFYGMREIGISEPNGHTVIFAAKASQASLV